LGPDERQRDKGQSRQRQRRKKQSVKHRRRPYTPSRARTANAALAAGIADEPCNAKRPETRFPAVCVKIISGLAPYERPSPERQFVPSAPNVGAAPLRFAVPTEIGVRF